MNRLETIGSHLDGKMSRHQAVIVGAARTAVGSYRGSLSTKSAAELAGEALKGALLRAAAGGLSASELVGHVEEVILGMVLTAGAGQNPARQAARLAGVSDSAPAWLVNKVCASGLKAVMLAAQSIEAGHRQGLIACGGMESMSQVPHLLPASTAGAGVRFGSDIVLQDGLALDGLRDPYDGVPMGVIAEQCALEEGISRADQDAYALRSYELAKAASDSRRSEIVPVRVASSTRGGQSTVEITDDDEPSKGSSADRLARLGGAFALPKGTPDTVAKTVTAGNSSKLSDGACVLLLASREFAEAHRLPILASVVAYDDAAIDPAHFTVAPTEAVQRVMRRAGVSVHDVDFVEINEAFSVVVLANQRRLQLDLDRVNVHGGAVSIGHPLGCSGARLILSLLSTLQARSPHGLGLATICNGGGGASALLVRGNFG